MTAPEAGGADPVRTTCPYCGVGCGVLATVAPDGGVGVAGDPEHPANFGRLCSKGSALAETLSLDDRVLHPLVDGVPVGWDVALDLVADRFTKTIAEHGPDAIAFYVSGQLLTEDYYVANKLMKGFVGSANIDTNSRLCMASSVAGHKRAFGSDTVPGVYEDLELADLVILVGSNLAWCHPVLFQRLEAARVNRGTQIVVVDPRRTSSCEIADLHLALAPGSDVALFNGLLGHLQAAGAFNAEFVARHTVGLDAALAVARGWERHEIAGATELSPDDIERFYRLFTATERTVTVYSQGVNQSASGTDKVNAILNCHLATGRIGVPGAGPFSVTGQPNAMGGREVGGLANMLAAHMELDNEAHRSLVQAFWQSPAIASKPGHKAVEMFEAVSDGRIKAIWIMATNPVDSMPEADTVRDALERCPFVVVSDVARHTDTTAHAHVLLPSAAWGEKTGTVTNSERRISRQTAFLAPPGEARPDWWQLAEVAKRMGFREAFSYSGPQQIFVEYARLTGLDNGGTRDLDIGALAALTEHDYEALTPIQWPKPSAEASAPSRFFADGRFYTPDRRARIVPTPYRSSPEAGTDEFPLILNTGRIRDQWHTMTRTAKAPRLMGQAAEPFVEIHPSDAARCGLAADGLAEVRSRRGSVVVRVSITERQRPGSVFVPMHWTSQLASRARIDALVAAHCDPVSGQPHLKQTPVAVTPFAAAWYGFAVTRERPDLSQADYWAQSRLRSGWRSDLAGRSEPGDFACLADGILCPGGTGGVERLAYRDHAGGQHRFACFRKDRFLGALFVARAPIVVAQTWLEEWLDDGGDIPTDRLRVLAGRPGAGIRDRGPIVCACFEVGLNQIVEAVNTGGCRSVESVGGVLNAGTNCGSCRPEIGKIIREMQMAEAG